MLTLEPGIGFRKVKECYMEVISGIEKYEISWCDYAKIDKIENEIKFNSMKDMESDD